jgi:SSS family solute:Na+ symporter
LNELDIAAIAGYFVLLLVVAFFTRRTRSFGEFATGRHSVPTLMVFASLAATIVGPGFSVGFAAQGWGSGFLFYGLALAYALQVVLVGIFVAPRITAFREASSLGDIMRIKYGALAQLLTGVVSVGLCIGFTAIMGKVGGASLNAVTGWPPEICLTLVTGTTALITLTGGLRATIATEGVQFALMCIVVATLCVLLATRLDDLSVVARDAARLGSEAAAKMQGWQVVGVVVSFFLGEALIPPYVNRALAAKSQATASKGFVLAGLFCVIWLAMVSFLGIAAHGVLPPESPGDGVFITLGRTLLPVGLFGVLLAAVLAIVMSSQEAVLNAGSVSAVRDIIGVVAPRQTKAHSLMLARVFTFVFALVAIFAAQYAPSIIDGLLLLYSIWAPTILVPLLLGLYLRRTRPLAGVLSIVAGGGVSLLWQAVLGEPGGVPAILVGLAAALAAYAIGHTASRQVMSPEGVTE